MYYWSNYHGSSFANLDNEFNPLTPVYVAYTTQTGLLAVAEAEYFNYSSGRLFPERFNHKPDEGEVENFRSRFQGKLLALEPGNYAFRLSTDDRGDLFVNGEQIVEGTNWDTDKSATLYLPAGTHDMQIAHGQGGGGYRVNLFVTPPGGSETAMPNLWLRPSVSTVGGVSGRGRLALPLPESYLRLQIDTEQMLTESVTGAAGSEIEKNGADTLTLIADNDGFGGTWYVLGGTLVAGDHNVSGTLGGERVYVAAGATLVFDRADDIVYTGMISGCGEIRSTGGGRVILTNIGSDFKGTFTTGTFVFTGSDADLPAARLEQGQNLDPLVAHFEDGARLLIPPPTGVPLGLPTLVFSNGTLALSQIDNSDYYIESLMIQAGGTAGVSVSKPSGLIGRYYELTDNPDPNHISSYFMSPETGEQYLEGYPFICAASSWDAGPTFEFGDSGGDIRFPQTILTSRREYFGAIWKGRIEIPETGQYEFMTNSDDNSMLFINGNLIVDNNGSHGMKPEYGQVTLTAGLHDIAILYAQGNGGFGLNVHIALPGQSLMPLPNSMLLADQADYALAGGIENIPGVEVMDETFTLEIGTLGVVDGPGTGTMDVTGNGLLNGTLLLNDLFIESPGAVVAAKGNTFVKGSDMNVTIGTEPPKGTLTKIADFTQTPAGLPRLGKTLTLTGSEKGRLVYKPDNCLYISTSSGTLIILR